MFHNSKIRVQISNSSNKQNGVHSKGLGNPNIKANERKRYKEPLLKRSEYMYLIPKQITKKQKYGKQRITPSSQNLYTLTVVHVIYDSIIVEMIF